MKKLITQLYQSPEDNLIYEPRILRLNIPADKQIFDTLLADGKVLFANDEIEGQLRELIKSKNPSIKIKVDDYPALIMAHLKGMDIMEYGVWAYYPWSRRLIHLLDEDEFIEVRTNRNQYKITRQEQRLLKEKKIGIVGLSVGQSIALTIAMERICGELRLADFDIAELSNLNRLRTGLHHMGINKTIIAAREIAEIDPFIKVRIFNDGLHKQNMDEFFTGNGKLDLFIEVCDGIDIKIESRFKARELKIPVVMDTNDKGMLDVERFDIEPDRPILHGLADGLDPDNIKNLSNEDKIPYILKMVGAETISTRLKASMMEVEQSINTWPQLASSVVLGGALTTDVCRRILLDQYHDSGRYYVDLEDLVKDKDVGAAAGIPAAYIGPPELTADNMLELIKAVNRPNESVELEKNAITEIVKAGIAAPSGGNAQPWKFVYTNKQLFVFHDVHFSYSLLDFNNLGSYVAIGAAIENITIKAAALRFTATVNYFPLGNDKRLAAQISFKANEDTSVNNKLETAIGMRLTNRNLGIKQQLSNDIFNYLKGSISLYKGAKLHIIDDEQTMADVGKLLAKAEMLRILHPRGHYDTFTNELRWTPHEINEKKDGLDVNTLGATKPEVAALKIAEDSKAIDFLRSLNGGNAFTKMVNRAVSVSSALGIITMPAYSEINFLLGGRAVERVWLEANILDVAFQPISQLVFLMARLKHGHAGEIETYFAKEVEQLAHEFYNLLPQLKDEQLIFIFRLSKADRPAITSLRRPIDSSFIYAE